MGLVRRWQQARAGAVIAECGTGKTLISLAAVQTHAENRPFTALAMVPPQLVEKWCREAILTLPRVRVFIIDGLRTPTNPNSHHGVNEVKLRNKRIVREGLRTSLSELRLHRTSPTPRKRWESLCPSPALFVVGRDRAKLGYFWRHAYQVARCGRYQGSVVNPDTGAPVYLAKEGERLLAMEGKFASDGLQAIDEGDDILMAMARELVTEKGIGESTDAVWERLVEKQAEVFGVRAMETSPSEMEAEPPERDVPEVIIQPPPPIPAMVTQLLMFGGSLESVPRRKASRRPSSAATRCLLLGFLLGSSLLLLLFSLLPTGIGVVFLHSFGENISLLAEVLLIHYSILVNDECHHAGRPVFRRIGQESETLRHFAVYDVTFRAAWAIFPLTR
jgi:hypothetical protein